MPTENQSLDTQSLKHLADLVSRGRAGHFVSDPEFREGEVRFLLPILGSRVALLARLTDKGILVGAIGLTKEAKLWLKHMMVTDSRLVVDGKKLEIYTSELAGSVEPAAAALDQFGTLIMETRAVEELGAFDSTSYAGTYWYANVVNFGDWLGPHLVRRLTGKRPVEFNRAGAPKRALFTVGSVMTHITRHNVDVWGTGLIRPLTADQIALRKKYTGIKVHAVRGKLTQEHVSESLGWEVPDVYGDPGLLMSKVYSPKAPATGKIAFVPHYAHKKYIGEIPGDIDVVNVQRDFRNVADSIAGARAVVSSSMHGLILAQSYGVPWIRLKVSDHELVGADFKFNDFYSTLDADAVQTHEVESADLASLDIASVAARAVLPDLKIDLDALVDALPVGPVEGRFRRTGTQLDYMPGIQDLDGDK